MAADVWRMGLTIVGSTATAALVALGGLAYSGHVALPYRWNPFAPYAVDAPRDALTPLRFWRTVRDPRLCSAALAASSMQYRDVVDIASAAGCDVTNAKRVDSDQLRFNHPFLASCPLALALARFDRETLQPAAQALYHQRVSRVNHVGSYACRAVRADRTQGDSPSSRLSEHAHANAIDLTGFVLSDGRILTVEHDWHADDTDARFLHRVHDGACGIFNTTLGPDYNALHRGHFHVDMGAYRMCR